MWDLSSGRSFIYRPDKMIVIIINDIFVRLPILTKRQLQMICAMLSALTPLLDSNRKKSFVAVNRAFRGFAPTIGLSVISSKKRPLNIIEGFYVIKPDNLWPARQSNNRRFLEADNETRNGLKRNMTPQRFSPAR